MQKCRGDSRITGVLTLTCAWKPYTWQPRLGDEKEANSCPKPLVGTMIIGEEIPSLFFLGVAIHYFKDNANMGVSIQWSNELEGQGNAWGLREDMGIVEVVAKSLLKRTAADVWYGLPFWELTEEAGQQSLRLSGGVGSRLQVFKSWAVRSQLTRLFRSHAGMLQEMNCKVTGQILRTTMQQVVVH